MPTSLIDRRSLLRSAAAAAALVTSSAWSRGSNSGAPYDGPFRHGVASGDPQARTVVLWTRVTLDTPAERRACDEDGHGRVMVGWQIAHDPGFRQIVNAGMVRTHAEIDHTVKIIAGGLAPGRTYYYRFIAAGRASSVGRTRTLPGPGTAHVRLGVFSCANYPAGYFNAYDDASRMQDLDATVHLGDYIYEYSRDGYASANAAALGRLSLPAHELLALRDYRERHAQYRSDLSLQALHAAAPMIAVWDDHEIANDAWRDGAENHDPTTEGSWQARRNAAIRAYHEWMPTRHGLLHPLYRSFDFGDLMSLHMLDTRLIGRDRQLNYADYLGASGLDAVRFASDLGRPERQLMGSTQTRWLQNSLSQSRARWQLLGQQVLMGRMELPLPLLLNFLSNGTQGLSLAQYSALLVKAQQAPGSLTAQEQALLALPAIPYNLDAWDGYPAARETVLDFARTLDKDLVVLAGDTHNAWASNLLDAAGRNIGVEFATPSVTSPGFEAYLPSIPPAQLAAALTQLIGPLAWTDTSRRGWMQVDVTPDSCEAQWRFVSAIDRLDYSVEVGARMQVLARARQLSPGS